MKLTWVEEESLNFNDISTILNTGSKWICTFRKKKALNIKSWIIYITLLWSTYVKRADECLFFAAHSAKLFNPEFPFSGWEIWTNIDFTFMSKETFTFIFVPYLKPIVISDMCNLMTMIYVSWFGGINMVISWQFDFMLQMFRWKLQQMQRDVFYK